MAEKVRLSQEEEVIELLRREGFQELTEEEVSREPYKSTYALPECFGSEVGEGHEKMA
jgi:hypothetical protein